MSLDDARGPRRASAAQWGSPPNRGRPDGYSAERWRDNERQRLVAKGVIYQMYPRSFQDFDEDGIGDLNGISQRLGHLVGLGIDAVWISPIFPSPMRDFGYDVSNYCAIHPLFGSLADFDALLESAHARGLRIILDFVLTTPPTNILGFRRAAPRTRAEAALDAQLEGHEDHSSPERRPGWGRLNQQSRTARMPPCRPAKGTGR